MRASPLVLKDYFMTDFRFSAQPGFDLESQQATSILPSDVKVDVEELLVPENTLARSYHITVSLEPSAGDKFPWIFNISLVGFFEISPDWPSDQQDRLFSANAPALLYSAARESLSMISGHGPYERALLPSITFVPLADDQAKQLEASERVELPAISETGT